MLNSEGDTRFFHRRSAEPNGSVSSVYIDDCFIEMNAEKLIWRTSGIKGNTSSFTNYDIMTSKNSYTKAEVDSLIASAGFGGTVDLTNYVTKTDFEELEDTVGNI